RIEIFLTAFRRRSRPQIYTNETQIVLFFIPVCSSKSVKICVDPWLNSFRKIEIARFVICDKTFPKFAECSILDCSPRLLHQTQIKMQIVQRDQAQPEDYSR